VPDGTPKSALRIDGYQDPSLRDWWSTISSPTCVLTSRLPGRYQ
jgi:hypothetical protein